MKPLKKFTKTMYKAVPVKQTLLEMKDLSELMMDLAYSAALFNNKELAQEVMDLETKVDNLLYQLNMNLMLATRDREDAEKLSAVAKIGNLTNAISDAAADIASLVLKDITVHQAVRTAFQQAEEHLTRTKVTENSILAGKPIKDLDLAAEIGADIIAVKRGDIWHINPDTEILVPGDVIVARGTNNGLEVLGSVARGEVDTIE